MVWRRVVAFAEKARQGDSKTYLRFGDNSLGLHFDEKIAQKTLNADFRSADAILGEARQAGVPIKAAVEFEVHAGNGRIADAYSTYRKRPLSKLVRRHLSGYALQSLEQANTQIRDKKLLVIATDGPGDELIFAGYYRALIKRMDNRVAITCDPRLLTIMQRAFPDVEFIAVNRLLRLWAKDNLSKLRSARLLPSLSLYRAFDDALWKDRYRFSGCILMSDALADLETERNADKLGPYVFAEPLKVHGWKTRLYGSGQHLLVGLSWRSTFNNATRSVHYLDVFETAPILNEDNCTFVVLQAKVSQSERLWLEKCYGRKLLFIDDLELFDDFESLAAILSCLDLVIAPTTYMIELAGAVGVNSILLSNSSKNFYRRDQHTKQDFLFPSVTHCESQPIGEKSSMVDSAVMKLRAVRNSFLQSR